MKSEYSVILKYIDDINWVRIGYEIIEDIPFLLDFTMFLKKRTKGSSPVYRSYEQEKDHPSDGLFSCCEPFWGSPLKYRINAAFAGPVSGSGDCPRSALSRCHWHLAPPSIALFP